MTRQRQGTEMPVKVLALAALVMVQVIAGGFFALDALSDFGVGPAIPDGTLQNRLELLAVAALAFSILVTGHELRRILARQRKVETQLRIASGAFADVVREHFERWQLTPSEREVALLALKGFAIGEIAALRETRPGTVKAQLNAVYTKAGVKGRHQLLSLFVEELMGEGLVAALPGRDGGPGSARGAAPAGAAEAGQRPEHHS